jgi:hypothetical protein
VGGPRVPLRRPVCLIRVRVTTLDKLCAADLPAPKLVKLDVEGAEVRALTGMLQTLRHHKPAIVCEIHGSLDEICKLLEAENYTVRPTRS